MTLYLAKREIIGDVTLVWFKPYQRDVKWLSRKAPKVHQLVVDALTANPDSGDIISGSGGWRKLRISSPDQGRGKRGAFRLVHYHLRVAEENYLLRLYAKNEESDLSRAFVRLMKDIAADIKRAAQTD